MGILPWCPNNIAQQLDQGIILPYGERRESTHHSFLGNINKHYKKEREQQTKMQVHYFD